MDNTARELELVMADALSRHRAGDLVTAGSAYDDVLARNPDHAEALHLKGVLLGQQGDVVAALKMLDYAVAVAPEDPRILGNRAKIRLDTGDVSGALVDYRAALQRSPDDPDMQFNVAGAYAADGKLEDAVRYLEQACRIAPTHARALANLGNIYRQLGRLTDSRAALERAVAQAPDDPQVHHSLGVTLSDSREYTTAAVHFREALAGDRGFVRAAAQLFYANLHNCDWQDRDKLVANFARLIESSAPAVAELSPLIALFLPVDQAALNQVSNARAGSLDRDAGTTFARAETASLHIGYLSADLGGHPVGHLLADILPHHNRDRFRVTAIVLVPPDGSDVQSAIFEAVDDVLDVSRLSAGDASERIRDAKLDILIDLGGFTRGARPEILAARAAPLQLGWLGYCGSGGGLNDAILADSTVLPSQEVEHFAEAVAYLPGSFMPLNNHVIPAETSDTREDHGLPRVGIVFCAFNAPTKIDPETFASWMAILVQVPDSVLWLRAHTDATTLNLQEAARERGVDPARLVFAPLMPSMDAHMARHRHADLFLDTFVYGAHSTAADAIAMGLPVLTLAGRAMPARVGASLCHAYGLSDLIADTSQDYVEIAVAHARDPELLHMRRTELAAKLPMQRDSAAFAQKLETAYGALWNAKLVDALTPGHVINLA